MIDTELFGEFETQDVAVRATLGSGFQAIRRNVREQPEFERLEEALDDSRDALAVANRALHLADRNTDLRYQNPHDIAFLGYLLLLEDYPELQRHVAERLLKVANLNWADVQARQVVFRAPSRSQDVGDLSVNLAGDATWIADSGGRDAVGEELVTTRLGPNRIGTFGRPTSTSEREPYRDDAITRRLPDQYRVTAHESGQSEERIPA